MSKSLRSLVFIVLFLAPCLSFGMEPATIKIQTSDEQEFEIERHVAQTSVMLKGMIEDIKEEAAIIPATITGQQFDLLLPAMLQLAQLHTTLPQASDEELALQLRQLVGNLKSNGKKLSNQQLIEFIAGANFLDIPLVQPALKALAKRILNKDELQQLIGLGVLGDKLKDLWYVHPTMGMFSLLHPGVGGVAESLDGKNLISWGGGIIKIWDKINLAEPIILRHSWVSGIIKSKDRKKFISWSWQKSSIKIWDKTNLAEPITLQHPYVDDVIESMDGNNLISWSWKKSSIKVWDKNNLAAESITLKHLGVDRVMESSEGKLISWSREEDTIKIWDKNNLTAKPITLRHAGVSGVIEGRDGNNLISWSKYEGTIKVWDKNNLQAEPITLQHPKVTAIIVSLDGNLISISWSRKKGTIKVWDKSDPTREPITLENPGVRDVIESMDGKNLISWSWYKGTIKIWNKNTFRELATLQHPYVDDVIESSDGNLISWSEDGTIKVWDLTLLNPTPEQILLLLAVYFASEGKKFELPAAKLSELRATFNTLSPITQAFLEKRAPDFITAIKAVH